jgi:NhaP-type Na+/H+ or K+/H+ antiporter
MSSTPSPGIRIDGRTGLVVGHHRLTRADTRQQGQVFWSLSTFLLNGALFILVGLEVDAVVRSLSGAALTRGTIAVAVVSAALVGVRFAFLFAVTYLIRLLDRRPP